MLGAVAASAERVFAVPAELGGRLDFPLFKPGEFLVQVEAVQVQLGGAPLFLTDGARLWRFDSLPGCRRRHGGFLAGLLQQLLGGVEHLQA
ncbi:hypothetical protein D3C76_1544110 [compost metagenome]